MKYGSQVRNPGRYVKLQYLIILALSASLLWCPNSLWAKPVNARQAEKAVKGWLKTDVQPLGTELGQHIMSVETFSDDSGQPTYYVVYLKPSGFVIVPGDDLLEPIICFAPIGRYDPSDDNPLGALVSRDVPGRIAAVRAFQATSGTATEKKDANNKDTALQKSIAKAQSKWSDIKAYADNVGALGITSISDVRVAPLTQSTWGQTTVGDYIGGITCYNYYTLNNWPCGCVAASMAQLIRYHEYPSLGPSGTYVWDYMPLQPDFDITLPERQAIGHLCHDAAESIDTTYGPLPTGSSASLSDAKEAFQNTFGYSNSVYGWSSTNIGAGLNGMVNPNLDAGYPVTLGVDGPSGGHSLICDGYGYNTSTLYHHLNMGWSGNDNAWYNLPYIDASYTFNVVDGCIYNIFISGSGEIISGRAVDLAGFPISGVSITATGGGTYYATTNNQGIYALVNVPSNTSFTVSASKDPHTFINQNVSTGNSSDWSSYSGNIWGVDFVSQSATPPTAYHQTVLAFSGTIETITFTAGDEGYPNPPGQLSYIIASLPEYGKLTDPAATEITSVPYTLVNNGNAVDYWSCPYFAGQDTFDFIANDGGTPPEGGDSEPAIVTIDVDNVIYTTFAPSSSVYGGLPMYTSYDNSRTQVIYLANDIEAEPKTITDLALDVYVLPGQNLNNWTIRMKHTSINVYSGMPPFETTGWTVVFQHNVSVLSTGWRFFSFDIPFEYNGTDNLLIDFSHNNSSYSTNGGCFISNTDSNRVLFSYADDTEGYGDPLDWANIPRGLDTYVPNIKLISTVSAQPMTGDFKPDCNVDMYDLSIFASAWQSGPSDSNWNPDCDLYETAEPVIDIKDVSVFVGHWLDYFE
jgi:hypothetical protein